MWIQWSAFSAGMSCHLVPFGETSVDDDVNSAREGRIALQSHGGVISVLASGECHRTVAGSPRKTAAESPPRLSGMQRTATDPDRDIGSSSSWQIQTLGQANLKVKLWSIGTADRTIDFVVFPFSHNLGSELLLGLAKYRARRAVVVDVEFCF